MGCFAARYTIEARITRRRANAFSLFGPQIGDCQESSAIVKIGFTFGAVSSRLAWKHDGAWEFGLRHDQ